MNQEILQQYRLLWQLGDWHAIDVLAQIDLTSYEFRDECALYISAACFQLGLLDRAKSYYALALEWGASKKEASRILISGAYNSLAAAVAIENEDSIELSLRHFKTAAEIALPGIAISSLLKARTQNQVERLQTIAPSVRKDALELKPNKAPTNNLDSREIVNATINNHYLFDETLHIWRREIEHTFTYSDGDATEQCILEVVRSCSDVSLFSLELLEHQVDWASEYHFSADRANLLRPFTQRLKNAHVLELGCGCGAITRFLGESGATVTAIEGSQQRASIAAERCRDLDKVTVVLDKLQDVPFTQLFDVVTLIGVLEYSRVYVDAEDPIQYVLEKARSYLKPDGILIVAIENQLGLKYFAGAPEDHGAGVMAGINDIYGSDTPVTFGKQELERRFLKAGFSKCETYLPFPDYKLPCLIVHPEGWKRNDDFDLGNLLAGSVYYDRQGIPNPLFSLESSWPLISRNGLTADLANSHLFIVHNSESAWQSTSSILASYYSPKRSKHTSQEVTFHKLGDKVFVSRRRQNGSAAEESTTEPYYPGELHSQLLHHILQRPGWSIEEIEQWLQTWVHALERALVFDVQIPEGWHAYDKWLPSNFIDAIPKNLIVNDEGLTEFIDLEWDLSHQIPLALVVYRGLVVTLSTITSIAEPSDSKWTQQQELLEHLLSTCGYNLSPSDYAQFIPVIDHLGRAAQGKPAPESPPTQPIPMGSFRVRKELASRSAQDTIATLYWRKAGESFNEHDTVKRSYSTNGKKQIIDLMIPPQPNGCSRLRLDIGERPGFYLVNDLSLFDSDGHVLWSWEFNLSQITNVGHLSFHKHAANKYIGMFSDDYDPQFELEIPQHSLDALIQGGSLHIEVTAYT
jgi:2-polyprenyl-3-methyl-5-hydroxy-6-metoxy-1,4-benzoquinol methylase